MPQIEATLRLCIEERLDRLRPAMEADGGGVELLSVTAGAVILQLKGACLYCPSQALTLAHAIVPTLREVVPAEMEIRVGNSCV